MADENENNDREGDESGQSIFDLFEPPPDPDPNQFGKIPVVRRDERGEQQETERQAAAEAEAAGLQHWTAPPTGQVPAVLASEAESSEPIKGPSWHGDDPSWSGPDLADVFADEEGVASHNAGTRSQRPRSNESSPPPITRVPREAKGGAARSTPSAQAEGAGAVDPPLQRPNRAASPETKQAVPPIADLPAPARSPRGPEATPLSLASSTTQAGDQTLEADGSRGNTALRGDVEAENPELEGHEEYEEYEDYEEYEEDEDFGLGPIGGRDLPQAIIAGVGLVAVLGLAAALGPLAMLVLILVLAVLAVVELYSAMRLAGLRPAALLGIAAVAALPAAAYARGDAAFPLIIALLVIFGALWYLVGADSERPVLNLSLTMFGVLWVGGLAAFGALMLRMEYGIEVLVATILITVVSDTMAYLGGKTMGSRPFHSASPNKTWEGTLIGFCAAVFAGLALRVLPVADAFQDNLVGAVLFGATVGVLAPIGDLAESLVKRDLGVKDMGTLIPGHGGVLDRLDGLLFALPGAYYLALIYGLFPIAS